MVFGKKNSFDSSGPYNRINIDLENDSHDGLTSITDIYEHFSQPVRDALARLAGALVARNTQITMFVSSEPGEGVTTTVLGIATVLALTHRVCLVDANLRNPSLHRVFQLPISPGLSEYLKRESSFESILRNTWDRKISLVSAGGNEEEFSSTHSIPSTLFRSKSAKKIFENLKSRFDFVLVDSAPANLYIETALLSSYVDGVAMIIASGRTQIEKVKMAKKTIEEYSGKIIGAVFLSDFLE